jgi:hypothetical protein
MRVWTWCFYFCLGGALGAPHPAHERNGFVLPSAALTIGAGGVLIWGFGVRWYLWGMDKAEYLYDDPTVMFMAAGLLMLCDVGCRRVSGSGCITMAIEKVSSAGLGVYVLQIPVRAVLQHVYQLGDPVFNIVLVPVAWVVLLVATLVLMRVPVLRWLVRIGLYSKVQAKRKVRDR